MMTIVMSIITASQKQKAWKLKHKESKRRDHKTRYKNRSRNEITVIITSSSDETRRSISEPPAVQTHRISKGFHSPHRERQN